MTEEIEQNKYSHEHQTSTLRQLSKKYKAATEQRTPAWYELVNNTFGGSEQAVISGKSKYGSIAEIVAQKAGLVKPMMGAIATRMGTIMEKSVSRIMKKLFSMKINEFGSITGIVPHLRCSPDGIGVARIKIGCKRRWLLILLEYKCPFTRIPDGTIPPDYIHQLKTGLCSVPEIDIALFVDSMIRLCKRADYDHTPNYNKQIHFRDSIVIDEPPIGMGTIIFYMNKQQRAKLNFNMYNDEELDMSSDDDELNEPLDTYIAGEKMSPSRVGVEGLIEVYEPNYKKIVDAVNDDDDVPYEELRDNLIDFCNGSQHIVNRLFELHEKGIISSCHIRPKLMKRELSRVKFLRKQKNPLIKEYTDDKWQRRLATIDAREKSKFKNCCHSIIEKGSTPIGYISWKLFKLEIVPYKNDDPNYLNKQLPEMMRLAKMIDEIRNSKTPWETYHKYFPTRHKKDNDNMDNGTIETLDEQRKIIDTLSVDLV